MYIKRVRKSNRNSIKVYEYLHLVENIRTPKGPRQRLVLNLGPLDVPQEQFKELANAIEAQLSGQPVLFSGDLHIEKLARTAADKIRSKQATDDAEEETEKSTASATPDYQPVDLGSISAGQVRSLGAEYVSHCVWEELQINSLLMQEGVSPHVLPLIEALVVGRLVSPGSERHTWKWVEERSALYELTGSPLRPSLNSLYRAGDRLFECKDALEQHLGRREKELFGLPERICLLDLTNTYFEGQSDANPKAKRGRSKEKRTDCKLLTLALVVDEHGFIKYSQLYPGNQSESHTLEEILDSMLALRPNLAHEKTVVIDAGIATKENVDMLKARQFHYIVVHRGKSDFTPDDTQAMQVIRQKENYTVEVARREAEGEVRLLCRSTGRQGKDQGIRSRQEDLFIERLRYIHEGLGKKRHTKRYDKVLEMVGRLREKYPRASKLYDVHVKQDTDATTPQNASAVIWEKRSGYDTERQFEGCYVLRTDRTDLSDKEIWETYTMLTRVESAFRSMKSALGLRPNFHHNEDRADAHMFISVLAYHILHVIEHRLRMAGDHRSFATIRDLLSTHHRLTIEYTTDDNGTPRRCHLRLCSNAEPEHRLIYQRLGLKETPLARKITTI